MRPGPCLFPSIGSPNPMLTGIAVARRTGDQIMTPPAFVADAGFEALFDGQDNGGLENVDDPQSAGARQPGHLSHSPRRVRSASRYRPWASVAYATDAAALCAAARVDDDRARRQLWRVRRFPDPEQQSYDNTAYVGVNFGFEIQIDELARPDNAPIHRTGAIYSFKAPTDGPLIVHPVGEWNPTKSPSMPRTSRWR